MAKKQGFLNSGKGDFAGGYIFLPGGGNLGGVILTIEIFFKAKDSFV